MKDRWQVVLQQYRAALRAYVERAEEADLECAYELSRQMVGDDRAMLDLVGVYHQELAALIRAVPTPADVERMIALAQTFFSESLSPFAMAQRGFRDTIARLHDLQHLLDVQQAISGAAWVSDVVARIVAHAARPLDVDACALWLPLSDGSWACAASAPSEGLSDVAGSPTPTPATTEQQGLIKRAIQVYVPVVQDSTQVDSRDPSRHGRRSQLAVALRNGDQVLGVLTFQTATAGAFGQPDVALAQLIAGYAAQAIERVRLLEELQQQNDALEAANRQLIAINQELEAFSYSVSHDLRAPLRSIAGFSRLVLADYGNHLDEQGKDYLTEVIGASCDMGQLIDALLHLSQVTRAEMRREQVDLSALARTIAATLAKREPEREVMVVIADDLIVHGDAPLLGIALENLLGNAWKFTRHTVGARIEVGTVVHEEQRAYVVRDNGAGFAMEYAHHLFGAFRRLHSAREFEGTGIGLATVQRIIHRHDGRIWAEGHVGQGAAFYFTLGTGLHDDEESSA